MKTYAYIRISKDTSDTENQRFEIENYCASHSIMVDEWIEEVVSGAKKYEDRKLGEMLAGVQSGDTIICTEVSRLGRSMTNLFQLMQELFDKEVKVYAIKQNFEIQNDLQSKILIFAFGIAAEIERDLISQRTKQALARKKAEGVVLGRKPGSKNKVVKLSGAEDAIRVLYERRCNFSQMARAFGVDRTTMMRFIKARLPDIEVERISRAHTTPEISEEDRNLLQNLCPNCAI